MAVLCPFCGHVQESDQRCDACGGRFDKSGRRSAMLSMGPWYIRNKQLPFMPGISYRAVKRQVRLGNIKANTIIRGPSTHQMWSLAGRVSGVAHLLGQCHACGSPADPNDTKCSHCGASFGVPEDPNLMGLLLPRVRSDSSDPDDSGFGLATISPVGADQASGNVEDAGGFDSDDSIAELLDAEHTVSAASRPRHHYVRPKRTSNLMMGLFIVLIVAFVVMIILLVLAASREPPPPKVIRPGESVSQAVPIALDLAPHPMPYGLVG